MFLFYLQYILKLKLIIDLKGQSIHTNQFNPCNNILLTVTENMTTYHIKKFKKTFLVLEILYSILSIGQVLISISY